MFIKEQLSKELLYVYVKITTSLQSPSPSQPGSGLKLCLHILNTVLLVQHFLSNRWLTNEKKITADAD